MLNNTKDCQNDKNKYKQIYSDIINCFTDAAKYEEGDWNVFKLPSHVTKAIDIDSFWMIFAALLMFLMNLGFSFLEIGAVSSSYT